MSTSLDARDSARGNHPPGRDPRGGSAPREARRIGRGGGFLLSTVGELLLLSLSALLFALSFPSFASRWGWFPLAFVALVPLFAVIRRTGWVRCALYGAWYGFASYALFNFWLARFHPLALFIVPPIHAAYFLVFFPVLKAAVTLFPRRGYLLQSLLWVGFEYLKAQGFLAYSYGILGYSQYLFLPLLQVASLAGVWGISLLVVFPSALLGNAWADRAATGVVAAARLPLAAWALVMAAATGWGLMSQVDLDGARRWQVALVQQNVDPWRGGNRAYRQSLDILLRQSRAALEKGDPEIVIWSETSFVPAIDWHTRYRTDPEAWNLVRELRDYLAKQRVPFLVGNDDGQLERDVTGQEARIDYNATILFSGGEIVETYRKLHLVPFTEYFPFKETLPGIYRWLKAADTHFWEKGREYTVFEAGGVRFSTPICFEDTFGYLNRNFVRRGAQVLVNMTNDSWSNSVAAEMQHMAMSVLRAAENRRSVVRATNGGITSLIDPNGRILDRLPPFTEGTLIGGVPVWSEATTPYTRWGDWFGAGAALAGLLFLVLGGLKKGLTRGRKLGKMDHSKR